MAPRERQRARSSKTSSEEYVLVVDGVPPNCRWQELKDYVGENGAPHRRQAQTYPDANGKPSGQGSVIIRDLEEAQRVYKALTRKGWDGRCISVVLAKRVSGGGLVTLEGPTESPGQPAWIPNPVTHAPNHRQVSMVSPPLSPSSNCHPEYSSAVDSRATYYAATGTYPPMLATREIAVAPNVMVVPHNTTRLPPAYAQYQNTHYVDVNNTPEYHHHVTCNGATSAYTNAHHVTVPNMSRHAANRDPIDKAASATIVSPNRTIFLTKLPYNAVGQVVRHLLEPFGKVERCDVPLDRTSPNKIQGTAVAKFEETSAAARAIEKLNGTLWKGVIISARWDKDAASIRSTESSSARPVQARHGASGPGRNIAAKGDDIGARAQRRRVGDGPLIVNGSRGNVAPSRSRRGTREDDSDSSGDDDEDEDDSSSDEDARPVVRRKSGKRH